MKKWLKKGETKTRIRKLADAEAIEELARILGGAEITDTVMKNAEEMKKLAKDKKRKK